MPDTENKNDDKLPRTSSDIIAEIEYIQQKRNPTIEHYLGINSYFEEITEAVKIIQEYNNGDREYELGRINEDLIRLSAIHVSTAHMVGYMQGYAQRAENVRKVTKSTYALKLKSARDSLERNHKITIKMTESEVDNASRSLAQDTYIEAADAETVNQMIRLTWYAIGDFIKILNAAANRLHQELHNKN